MKEATGELNMTVVTVVAIAAVGAFFYAFVWPAVKNNITQQTYCSNAVCDACTETSNGKRTCDSCVYVDKDGSQKTIKCVFNTTSSTSTTTK